MTTKIETTWAACVGPPELLVMPNGDRHRITSTQPGPEGTIQINTHDKILYLDPHEQVRVIRR